MRPSVAAQESVQERSPRAGGGARRFDPRRFPWAVDAPRRQSRRRRWQSRRITPESSLLRTILDGCAALRVPCWRLNTGAGVMGGSDDSQDSGRWVEFGFPGCPDLVALLPDGRTLWIEAKSHRGRLTPDQVDFRNLCVTRGIPHVVARSWEDIEVWVRERR